MSGSDAGESGAAGHSPAVHGSGLRSAEVAALRSDLERVLAALEGLSVRIGALEEAVADASADLGKVRKTVSELKHETATRKQVKKLKKVLDQLEVIEVGPEDASAHTDRE